MLIIVGLLFFAVLTRLRREYGVYLIVLLLPTYQIRFSVFGLPMTFLECLILIAGALALPTLFREHKFRENIFIYLLLLAAAIAVFVSPVPIKAAGIWKAYFFEPVLFYFLVKTTITTPKKLQNLWTALSLLVLSLSLFGLYQFFTLTALPTSWWAVDVASRRITSLLNHPNALGLLLGPALAMLFFLPNKSWLNRVSLGLGLVAFYLTFSRAGWLAFFATLAMVALATRAKKFSLTNNKLLLVLLLLVVTVFAIPFSRHKLLDLASFRDPTQENRYVLWSAGADMLKRSPVLGVGLMGFHEQFKNYPVGPDQVVQNYPHNFFLNFWLETGFLGLFSIIALLILFYKKIRQLLLTNYNKSLAIMSLAGMTTILLHGLVDVPYFKNDLSVLFWLVLALPDLSFD